MGTRERWVAMVPAALLATLLAGCGTPGAPLPPSLNLPNPVTNLTAVRTGEHVALTWTMPRRNTDKLLLKGEIDVSVCRKEGAGACEPAGHLTETPEKVATFDEKLPAALSTGEPRVLRYFVELKNAKGRSAGLSNGAGVLAGEAPGAVQGFSAEVRKAGVVLHWTADEERAAVRLQRTLLNPPPAKPKGSGPLGAAPEPVELNLLVEGGSQSGGALDKSVHFGNIYAYRAQRVTRVETDGQTLELDGALTEPVRVEVKDVFPPATPRGLAAVASIAADGTPAIDLSWQPNTEPDLAGYLVYRREGDGPWQRISPEQPVVGPGFHDAQVQIGHTYRYAVSAIDQGGHESARSAETEETVPSS